jgi:hypothetical protein
MKEAGLTVLELLLVMILTGILVIGIGQVYVTGLGIWQNGYERSVARDQTAQALERMSQALRQAKNIDAFSESSIIFTADLGAGDDTYRFYLYHPAQTDAGPPYTQSVYQLRGAQGDVSYGEGAVLAQNIRQPATAPFSLSSGLLTVDLTRNFLDSSMRFRSNVRLRNL